MNRFKNFFCILSVLITTSLASPMAFATKSVPAIKHVPVGFYALDVFFSYKKMDLFQYKKISKKQFRVSFSGSKIKSDDAACSGKASDLVFEVTDLSDGSAEDSKLKGSSIEFLVNESTIEGKPANKVIAKADDGIDTGIWKYKITHNKGSKGLRGLSLLNISLNLQTKVDDNEDHATIDITVFDDLATVATTVGDDDYEDAYTVTTLRKLSAKNTTNVSIASCTYEE